MKHPVSVMPFIILIVLFLLTPLANADHETTSSPEGKKEIKAKLEKAKRIYFDYYKDSMNLDRSINILEEILEKDPKNVEAMLLLSRVWLTYGYAKAPNDEERIRTFKNGIKVAKKAIELAPDNPDAHFFYVANLASLGATHGILRSLFLLPEIRREVELILELDPNHIYGLAMKGLLYYALPGFLGGDPYIAEIYLKRAISLDPHLTAPKLYLAAVFIKQGKYDEAKKTLKEVIKEKNPTIYADWYLNKQTAEEMITKIEKKESRRTLSHSYPLEMSRD
jgi:tetratricopeptide (TPR) repeat protein